MGANPCARFEPFDRLSTHLSYLIGADPQKWRRDVPVWGGVRYADLYPGVDLELSAEGGTLVLSLLLRSGAPLQPSMVRLRVEGADGLMATEGGLVATTPLGELLLPWFELDGTAADSLPRPVVIGNEVINPFTTFPTRQAGETAEHPSAAAAEIRYATFLGGTADDEAYGIAVDSEGAAYITGQTSSYPFPVGPGYDTTPNGYWDAFVAKLAPDGTALLYGTFLGGSNHDGGLAVDVNGLGQVYVAGWTLSADFPAPTGMGYDTSPNGGKDAFVIKLNASGTDLLYSTFLGGSFEDSAWAMQIDDSGCAYVTGYTRSPDFCAIYGPGYNRQYHGGDGDAFAIKLSADGKSLVYATFLGGSGSEAASGVAIDSAGQAYVTGPTSSDDFPAIYGPGYDTSFHGGGYDTFVVKLSARGTALLYATYLGGAGDDPAFGIAVDGDGCAYVVGETTSTDFPAAYSPGYDTVHHGGYDAFVAKLDRSGTSLTYATFLGGSGDDRGDAIALDALKQVYITGWTASADFPQEYGPGSGLPYGGDSDAFLAKLSNQGSALLYSSFMGGNTDDEGQALAVDSAEQAYLVGRTTSADFPAYSGPGYDRTYNGSWDAFALSLVTPLNISGRVTDSGGHGIAGVTLSVDPDHWAVTDVTGVYIITALIAGTYVLTPTLGDYMFSPPTWVLGLPPSAFGVDFVGEPAVSVTPTATPTVTPTSRSTSTSTSSATPISTLTRTKTPAPAQTPTSTPTRTRTTTPTPNSMRTLTVSPTVVRTATATPTGTRTSTPSRTPTRCKLALPLVLRIPPPAPSPTPSVTPTMPCDAYELNDVLSQAWGPLRSGQVYQARLCSGDAEDNYYFDISSTDEVMIRLQLPASLMNEPMLWVYGPGNANPSDPDFGGEVLNRDWPLIFRPLQAGRYIIRIYASTWDNAGSYALQVTYH